MKHGSLFSGLGGFDLAASWLGWENIFQCEIDPFCQKVLKYHFPNTTLYEDIKKTDFKKYKGTIDIISGGFPCQPFSTAGKRKGTEDDRFLWPEMLRTIQDVEPTWVVAENVHGIVSQQNGVVFEGVCSDLETIGYEVQSFIIPACSVNAPHKRDRLWIIANANGERCNELNSSHIADKTSGNASSVYNEKSSSNHNKLNGNISGFHTSEIPQFETPGIFKDITSNTKSERFQKWNGEQAQFKAYTAIKRYNSIPNWENFPTQSPVHCGDDGFSDRLDAITFPKWRRDSIKGYGNAIVPQIAYEIFEIIDKINNHETV